MHRSPRRPGRLPALLAVTVVALLAACAPATPSTPPPATPSATAAVTPGGTGPRPIVIDTDMGMDDLLAIYVLLRDPAVDVRAIAIDGTGLVRCGAGERNLRRILGAFDRLDIPFGCGRDDPGPDGIEFPPAWRDGADAMYGVVLPPVVTSVDPPDAVTVIAQALAGAPSPVTIVALGTWTNIQDLLAVDPGALDAVERIHAMAGAVDVDGNMEVAGIRPADRIEWNVGADPDSVADVLATGVAVTLVPLDATDDVPVPPDVLAQLEADHAAAGADIAYETYARAPYLRTDGNYWWDATAAVALTDPSLLAWEDADVAISERGRLTRSNGGRPVRFATGADTEATQAAILAGLRRGAPRPEPFTTTGTVRVTWDGSTCRLDPDVPATGGLATVAFENTSSEAAGLLAAGVQPPHTWEDALAFVRSVDLADPAPAIPDWLLVPEGEGPQAAPGTTATALVELPPTVTGFLCATGTWPSLEFHDAGSIDLGG